MPDEYISRERLLEDINAAVEHGGMGEIIGQTLRRYILRQPAADVAPVVRCKDCIYNIDGLCFCRRPLGNGVAVEPDDFCRWGETE